MDLTENQTAIMTQDWNFHYETYYLPAIYWFFFANLRLATAEKSGKKPSIFLTTETEKENSVLCYSLDIQPQTYHLIDWGLSFSIWKKREIVIDQWLSNTALGTPTKKSSLALGKMSNVEIM